jgi:hypothetical protein
VKAENRQEKQAVLKTDHRQHQKVHLPPLLLLMHLRQHPLQRLHQHRRPLLLQHLRHLRQNEKDSFQP